MGDFALDASSYLHANVLPLPFAVVVATAVLTLSVYWTLYSGDNENAVAYDIALPDEPQASLPHPSLKIPNSTAIQCYTPATGKLLGRVNPHHPEGIDRAVSKASEAQKIWAKTSFAERRRVLKTLLKFILDHQDEIVRVACLDSGKPRVDAALGEVLVTVEKLRWTIKHGEKALSPEKRSTTLLMLHKSNEVRWEPMGVVAALVSWNYPFHNLLNPMISALFAGNGILVKSSEATCWSAQYFTAIARGALTACGHSPHLIQLITCWPETAPHLTSHPGISHITFIGSQNIAHSVASSASKPLTPLTLELGGKDPAILLNDIPPSSIAQTASILMRGVFQSAGQNCIGIERVIALPKTYKALIPLLLPRIRGLRIGSALDSEESVDIGACISDVNFLKLEELIEDAISRGARLLHGGKRYHHPKYPQGHYFTPTLIVDATPEMPLAQTELFAPVFTLMRATSVSDAVSIANSTQFGLGASVFGNSTTDLEYVTSNVKAGMVSVNDFASYYLTGLPFGGVGGSGYGRFLGEEGLRSLCNQKSVQGVAGWARVLGVKTRIPGRLDYPFLVGEKGAVREAEVGAKAKAWEFVKGVVEVGYATTFLGRVRGLGKILRNS